VTPTSDTPIAPSLRLSSPTRIRRISAGISVDDADETLPDVAAPPDGLLPSPTPPRALARAESRSDCRALTKREHRSDLSVAPAVSTPMSASRRDSSPTRITRTAAIRPAYSAANVAADEDRSSAWDADAIGRGI